MIDHPMPANQGEEENTVIATNSYKQPMKMVTARQQPTSTKATKATEFQSWGESIFQVQTLVNGNNSLSSPWGTGGLI